MILLPSHDRGTMILAELPNSLDIAVISDTWRVEHLFISAHLSCMILLETALRYIEVDVNVETALIDLTKRFIEVVEEFVYVIS